MNARQLSDKIEECDITLTAPENGGRHEPSRRKGYCFDKGVADKGSDILHSITDINSLTDIHVKGNSPYKVPGKIPLQPEGDKKYDECSICVRQCPMQAIPENTPRKTDKKRCIACGRCIVVCPQNARRFGGILYKLAGKQFVKSNAARKEPELIFAK